MFILEPPMAGVDYSTLHFYKKTVKIYGTLYQYK